MNRVLFFSRFYYILFGIALLSIPFTKLFYFFITPLLLLLWIIEGNWNTKWNRLKDSHTLIISCCFVLFWFMNVIGLFYSNDLVRGVMRTYDKLPFLVYPLVFFTLNKTYFTQKKIYALIKGFIYATAISLMISWGQAFVQYFITGNTYFFYYIHFSKYFGHPSYCALIVCIAFALAFYIFNNPIQPHSSALSLHIPHRWFWIALFFFFAISIYFFQSRSGFITFVFVLFGTIFYYLHTHKKSYWYGVIGMLIVLLFAAAITKWFPNRIEESINKINTKQLQVKNMVGSRSEIWDITWKLAVKNKMLGIGTGYHTESYLTGDELIFFETHHSFINAHNQFLQTFLEHGIFALFLLSFLIIYSFYFAIKTKNELLLMLMSCILINILFESMFERGHGIFIFNLFYCLFLANNIILQTTTKEIIKIY